MNVTGVDFAYIPTTDIDCAVDFYGNVLGLAESARYGQMPGVEFETGSTSCPRRGSTAARRGRGARRGTPCEEP